MSEPMLAPNSAVSNWAPISTSGLAIAMRDDLTIAGLAAFRDTSDALAQAIVQAFGTALPLAGKRVSGNGVWLQWAGADQWHVLAQCQGHRDLEQELKPLVGALAAVVDHSDARAVFTISGRHARDVLAKGLPIDLDERAFATGDVAITHANHIGITIACLDEAPTFEVTLYRSYAESFAEWLRHAAAEFIDEPRGQRSRL